VQPPHRAALCGVAVVDLGDGLTQAGSGKLFGAEEAGEKPACFAQAVPPHPLKTRKGQVGDHKTCAHAKNNHSNRPAFFMRSISV